MSKYNASQLALLVDHGVEALIKKGYDNEFVANAEAQVNAAIELSLAPPKLVYLPTETDEASLDAEVDAAFAAIEDGFDPKLIELARDLGWDLALVPWGSEDAEIILIALLERYTALLEVGDGGGKSKEEIEAEEQGVKADLVMMTRALSATAHARADRQQAVVDSFAEALEYASEAGQVFARDFTR